MKYLVFITLVTSSITSFAFSQEEVARIENASLRMCVQNAANSYTWTWQVGGAIKDCLSQRLDTISLDDCEIAASQLFYKSGVNEAMGICLDHFRGEVDVHRCFQSAELFFYGRINDHKYQCLQESLQAIDFEECSLLADQIGQRAHRLCSATIPIESLTDQEISQDASAL